MAAFRARRLVRSEMSATARLIWAIRAAWSSSTALASTEPRWRSALDRPAAAEALIPAPTSARRVCSASLRRRPSSARRRASAKASVNRPTEASDSCEAPAASSAPEAICSSARRNSSAAPAASLTPPASSCVAAAMRSAAVSFNGALAEGARFRVGAGVGSEVALDRTGLADSLEVFTSAMHHPKQRNGCLSTIPSASPAEWLKSSMIPGLSGFRRRRAGIGAYRSLD